jgi:hypothetical protein
MNWFSKSRTDASWFEKTLGHADNTSSISPQRRISMGYEDAPAAKMLSSFCIFCGRPLVDAQSVTRGYGSECANKVFGAVETLSPEVRQQANQLVFQAAIEAQRGHISGVLEKAQAIKDLGLQDLGDKVEHRFVNATRNVAITITEDGDFMAVTTPYRRGMSAEFVDSWRGIPGRRWDKDKKANLIPLGQKKALWELLCKFFGGEYGVSPKGIFRIPSPQSPAEQIPTAPEASQTSPVALESIIPQK